jgi:hypothetical protein
MRRPGTFAARATGQYRARDTLTYLGLRYYLENTAASSDRWVGEVATSLVRQRNVAPYHRAYHFKELGGDGEVQRRELMLPAPNEALAEAFLIDSCATRGGHFARNPNVFSYWPSKFGDRKGVFFDYVIGLKDRHAAITSACHQSDDVTVCFRDIKRFYPSLRIENARRAWKSACEVSGLDRSHQELGDKLLNDHAFAGAGHLLTGPMFSHFIGNLYLRPLDERMREGPAQYVRYVDDVTLIGSRDSVRSSLAILQEEIDKLELTLHGSDSPKSLTVSKNEWLLGENDYGSDSPWMYLIGDIKKFLLWYPESTEALRDAMVAEDLRLPLPDYSVVVRESSHVERALRLMGWGKYRKGVQGLKLIDLVVRAKELRASMDRELVQTLEKLGNSRGYSAKRLVTRCRYLAGRLIYIAESDRLGELSHDMRSIPDLTFHAAVAHAVSSRNVDELVDMGVNAAQAASQPLRASARTVSLTRPIEEPWQLQVTSILAVNGLHVDSNQAVRIADPLHRFATQGVTIDLMKHEDAYVRELACLHGLQDGTRHQSMMETAFDPAQDIVLDAIEQARGSLSI